jgi:selenocysteine-specific elongation factor
MRTALAELARSGKGEQGADYRWFRLPIDRAFNIAGRGTVVTGSVSHGGVQADDELELWPSGRRVRAREMQTHHEGAAAAAGRMRLALNLAGVSLEEVGRGCELATPGYLETTRTMDVRVTSVRMPGKALRKNIRLRLHIATSEVLAELRLMEAPTEPTVRDVFAQLRLAEPIVAAWGQRFILRDESGSRTLGGGTVLRPVSRPWTGKRPAHVDGLRTLVEGAAKQRLEEVIRDNVWRACSDELLATRAGLGTADRARARCQQLLDEDAIKAITVASTPVYIHESHLTALAENVVSRLGKHLEEHPRLPGVPRNEWPGWMPRACSDKLRPALADWLVEQGCVALADGFIVPPGHAGAMSADDQQLLDAICDEIKAGAFQPPSVKALSCVSGKNTKRAKELIDLAGVKGMLIRINGEIWLHADCWERMVELVTGAIRESGGVSVSDIRTLVNSSRKYVVPFAESLDAAGITRRVGDKRVLGPNAPS